MITKKHFEKIAESIKLIPYEQRYEVADAWAIMCAEMNRRFDREKFMSACGFGGVE